MSKLQFQLEFLDGLVPTLQSMAGEHEDMSASLRGHAGSAQSIGADGWIVDQVRYAASLLAGHPDLFRQLASELGSRLDLAHQAADLSSGGPTALRAELTLAMTAAAGLLKAASGSAKANQRVQVAAKKSPAKAGAAATAGVAATGAIPKAATIANVPFLSQLDGSVYTDASGKAIAKGTGGNNCGPTSIAMVIDHYAQAGPGPVSPGISILEAANRIRGGAQNNYVEHNHTEFTNFGIDQSATGTASAALLKDHGLGLTQVSAADGLTDVQRDLGAGHPVIMTVNATAYADQDPYAAGIAAPEAHIVVAIGYDTRFVYVNDPLASKGNLAIPVDEFTKAATTVPGQSPWYGAAVAPIAKK